MKTLSNLWGGILFVLILAVAALVMSAKVGGNNEVNKIDITAFGDGGTNGMTGGATQYGYLEGLEKNYTVSLHTEVVCDNDTLYITLESSNFGVDDGYWDVVSRDTIKGVTTWDKTTVITNPTLNYRITVAAQDTARVYNRIKTTVP